MFDFSDANPHMRPMGELIPDGSFCKLEMTFKPGGVDGGTPGDKGLLKKAHTSDVLMLEAEFTVIDGPLARRKFWQNFTVQGGKKDNKGASIGWNMAKNAFRGMIDSALGLDPNDKSDATNAKRKLESLSQLSGIKFVGRVMIEPASSEEYNDSNRLANAVFAHEAEYAAVMNGQHVEPDPINAKPRKQKEGGAAGGGGGWNAGAAAASNASQAAAAETTAAKPGWLGG